MGRGRDEMTGFQLLNLGDKYLEIHYIVLLSLLLYYIWKFPG